MDLTGARWRKSSYSGSNGGTCVEVASVMGAGLAGVVAVRDSKDPQGPVLVFTPDEWRVFAAGVKAGDFGLG